MRHILVRCLCTHCIEHCDPVSCSFKDLHTDSRGDALITKVDIPAAHSARFRVHAPSAWWQQDGLSLGDHAIAFLLTALALISRRPDMFFHPQFYAEDGLFWYAQAYNTSWLHALLMPQAGYMQTFPRLVAGLALQVPMRLAPLLMNSIGLLMQALPVTALLSSRCRTWGTLRMRLLMSTIYIAIPNAGEIHVVATNAQWHLVVLEMLLAFADAPKRWLGRVGDILLFATGAISGPFSILLLPLTLLYWWKRRQPWTLVLAVVIIAGASWELLTILHAVRYHVALGATPGLFARIYGGEVILDGILAIKRLPLYLPTPILAIFALGGLLVTAMGFLYGTLPMRLLIAFSAMFFVTALRSPLLPIIPGKSAWSLLAIDWQCRYWFYPLLAFLWSAVYCITQHRAHLVRIAGYCVLIPLVAGSLKDWKYPPFANYHWAEQVRRVEQAHPGEPVTIPLYPPGWSMQLIKRR